MNNPPKHNQMKRFRRRNNNGASNGYNNNSGNTRRNNQFGGQEQYDRKARNNAQNSLNRHLDLARDAVSMGDETKAENHFQHADHYQRIINECDKALGERQPQRQSLEENNSLATQSEDQPRSDDEQSNFDDYLIEDNM